MENLREGYSILSFDFWTTYVFLTLPPPPPRSWLLFCFVLFYRGLWHIFLLMINYWKFAVWISKMLFCIPFVEKGIYLCTEAQTQKTEWNLRAGYVLVRIKDFFMFKPYWGEMNLWRCKWLFLYYVWKEEKPILDVANTKNQYDFLSFKWKIHFIV